MTFRWVNAENPEDYLEVPWYGQGVDDGEKGVGKALTYAEKYFVLKFFHIATDKDDPDSWAGKHEEEPQQHVPDTPQYLDDGRPCATRSLNEALLELGITSEAAVALAKRGREYAGIEGKFGDLAPQQIAEVYSQAVAIYNADKAEEEQQA